LWYNKTIIPSVVGTPLASGGKNNLYIYGKRKFSSEKRGKETEEEKIVVHNKLAKSEFVFLLTEYGEFVILGVGQRGGTL